MKFSYFFFVFLSFSVKSQISYEFIQALPPNSKEILCVDREHFGMYDSDSSDIVFELNAAGIFTRNLVIQSISRETLRENSKFEIKGDYIFGIDENDSLPCVLDGENYYFGISRRDTIIRMNGKNQLRKVATGEYIVNFEENGLYTPCLLKFNGSALSIRYFDYPSDKNIFTNIKSQQSKMDNDMTITYLLPNEKEWKKIDKNDIFGKETIYKRTQ